MFVGENVLVEFNFTVLCGTDVRIPYPLLEDTVDGIVHFGHPESFPLGGKSYGDR